MKRALSLCAALACVACMKRVAPAPVEDRTAGSGVPQHFGAARELPEGTSISWDFGDGTPPLAGPEATHAFPRAGNFTITETVRDRDGTQRASAAHVTVLRRSVPMAVPADVRGAFIAQQPWARAKAARDAARRVGLGDLFDETADTVSAAVGFDATDAAAVAESGIDPDEGVALYTVPQDDEAVVVCVGISDLDKAEAALRKLVTSGAQPFILSEVKLPTGERAVTGTREGGAQRIGWLERFGYLYLRTRGRNDPLLALASAAQVPEAGGLERDAGYQKLVAQVGAGDAVFYSAAPRPGELEEVRRGPFASQLGASAFSVSLEKAGLTLKLFSELRTLSGQALQDTLTPRKAPPDLAAQLPGGAAAFLKHSGAPEKVWQEMLRSLGPDGPALRDRLREFLGVDMEKQWLPLFTGNVGVGVYLDAAALLEAFLGEQVSSLDRSTFVAAGELAPGKDDELRRILDQMLRANHAGAPLQVRGATFWKLSDTVQIAWRPGWIYAALGGGAQHEEPAPPAIERPAPPRAGKGKAGKGAKAKAAPPAPQEPTPSQLGPLAAILLPDPAAHRLGDELVHAEVSGFEVPQDQVAWVDIQGVLHALERAADEQGGMVASGVRLLSGRVHGLRDALFTARPSAAGLGATLSLRYVERGPPHAQGK